MGLTAKQLSAQVQSLAPDLNIQHIRDSAAVFHRFASLFDAQAGDLSFLANPKYASQLANTLAGALVLNDAAWQSHQALVQAGTVIVCNNPYAYFAFASQVLETSAQPQPIADIHPSASIAASASIGQQVRIGAFVHIGECVRIGDGCQIDSHVSIGDHASIAANTRLYNHVTLYHGVQLGQNNIVHAGTVIGSDGFGFAPYQKRWIKIPQTGTVIIADDVEIGSNCSIDRGALGDTRIGRGTKLDNLIQIAHNVQVGEDCAFAANIAIAGSAVIGNRVQMGGKAGVLGHLSVCDDVIISSCTLVTKSIAKAGFYSGVYPIQENADWEKNAVALKRLNALRLQVRALEQAIDHTKIK
jgi:UDP-3-O-[3-hydroxymyristoyl] glucosamine N-acyltransferase